MMLKFPLEIKTKPIFGGHGVQFKQSLPFVENARGVLIHRPRYAAIHKLLGKEHMSVGFYCGMHASSRIHLTFLPEPPEGRIVCERCEESALKAGLPSSDELAGRHVCKGGVKAASHCCGEKAAPIVKE